MKTRLRLTSLLLCATLAAHADLIIVSQSQDKTALPYDNIKSLTITDGNLVVTDNEDTPQSYALTDISICYFSTEAAQLGTDNVEEVNSEFADSKGDPEGDPQGDPDGIKAVTSAAIRVVGNSLIVEIARADMLYVYNAEGQVAFSAKVQGGTPEHFDFSNLADGIYVVKVNGQTLKVLKQ